MIELVTFGALPAVQIRAADGAGAIVTLYGAHLVSWTGADGEERLFCSAKSALDGSRPIRGGVPVIFPQFAERGSGMRHGFARISTWRQGATGVDDGAAWAEFELANADLATPWEQAFGLTLRVAVKGAELVLALTVQNDGATPLHFSSALHTYFLVDDLAGIGVGGVRQGLLRIDDKLDCIYRAIDGNLTLEQARRTLLLEQSGFTDAVVWNPGPADAAALADLDDAEYLRFVCIEPALIEPFELAPGARWEGRHRISSIP